MRQFSPLFSSSGLRELIRGTHSVGFLRRGRSCPEHKNLAALFGALRALQPASLDMKRRARPVLLALVDKIPCLRNTFVRVRRDDGMRAKYAHEGMNRANLLGHPTGQESNSWSS
jgi:hypothetical protein